MKMTVSFNPSLLMTTTRNEQGMLVGQFDFVLT